MHCPSAGGGESGDRAFLMPIDRQTRDFAYADCAAPAIWLKTGEADTTGMMHPAIMDEECRERGERGAHYGGTRRGTFCGGVGGGTLHAHHAIRKIRNVPETVSRTSHSGTLRREILRTHVRQNEFRWKNTRRPRVTVPYACLIGEFADDPPHSRRSSQPSGRSSPYNFSLLTAQLQPACRTASLRSHPILQFQQDYGCCRTYKLIRPHRRRAARPRRNACISTYPTDSTTALTAKAINPLLFVNSSICDSI